MDFFEAQANALRRSRRLIFLFGAAVASMIAVVYLALLIALGFVGWGSEGNDTIANGWINPSLLAAVTLAMTLVIGLGSAFRTAQLRRGGSAVAELLGGRAVAPDSSDLLERRLLNVVEEMSIAAGIPVPSVFVLDREPGINAFAAGHTIHDAAVGFTRGSLESLSRDELQGVVAHEFSHILNGDMRLNLRLIGLLFGILLLTVVGRGILRGGAAGRGRGRGSGPQVVLVGLVLVLLGYLGVLFGRLIQAGVSREREYLADAAAVQFTRSPDGIAGALRKIGGDRGSALRDHHAQEAEHMLFADGVRSGLGGVFATHPPLANRIRRIDPAWDGSFSAPSREPTRAPPFPSPSDSGTPSLSGASLPLAALLLASVGTASPDHLRRARQLLASLPDEVREASRSPAGATALLVALLLGPPGSGDPSDRWKRVADLFGTAVAGAASRMRNLLAESSPESRLLLLDLLLPALRGVSEPEADGLRTAVGTLIRADGRVDPFELVVYHVLKSQVGPKAHPGPPPSARTVPLARLRSDVEAVLSALARAGARDEGTAARAFEAGTSLLSPPPDGWRLHPTAAVELERVDAALDRLRLAHPEELRHLLEAATATVLGDGEIRTEEVELLRAYSEALGVPIPPPEGIREMEGEPD